MKKLSITLCTIGTIIILCLCSIIYFDNQEIKTIKNDKELLNAYNSNYNDEMPLYQAILSLPFSAMFPSYHRGVVYDQWNDIKTDGERTNDIEESTVESSSNKDYSKTNIQVEGVDEADIIKTDGNYIYSISENKVLITNTKDPNKINIESTINEGENIPVDLILYNNVLVIISSKQTTNLSRYWYNSNSSNTVLTIYNIKDRKEPKLVKSIELHEPYNTTRCIDSNLYVFSTGILRTKNGKVDRKYKEDSITKELDFKDIKYLKDNKTNVQTLIAEIDLNNLDKDIALSSYLIDISNAYVSKENIYLLNSAYGYNNNEIELKDLFTLKGIFGIFNNDYYDYNYETKTQVYKFKIDKNEGVKYLTNTKVVGSIINQYSLDEKDENLRIALDTKDGTQVVVLDKKLKKIGESDKVAEGERMYASRFMGNKAYLVTFKNTDPLFVIDLSDPTNPEVLGELKIPGYSTYLHPYDENHIIGIGMNTEEVVHRDHNGRVTGTWTEILGMKMALFDVSDVKNPKEIDSTTIGDRRTVSAVLSNPKALLFSKEKNLLAIPVNNYPSDFSVKSSEEYESSIYNFTNYSKNYTSEGYFVYNIDLNGFTQKGIITHDKTKNNYYYNNSKLLRGLYIDNNLYTVSEDYIKVNKLEDLEELNSLKLKGEE